MSASFLGPNFVQRLASGCSRKYSVSAATVAVVTIVGLLIFSGSAKAQDINASCDQYGSCTTDSLTGGAVGTVDEGATGSVAPVGVGGMLDGTINMAGESPYTVPRASASLPRVSSEGDAASTRDAKDISGSGELTSLPGALSTEPLGKSATVDNSPRRTVPASNLRGSGGGSIEDKNHSATLMEGQDGGTSTKEFGPSDPESSAGNAGMSKGKSKDNTAKQQRPISYYPYAGEKCSDRQCNMGYGEASQWHCGRYQTSGGTVIGCSDVESARDTGCYGIEFNTEWGRTYARFDTCAHQKPFAPPAPPSWHAPPLQNRNSHSFFPEQVDCGKLQCGLRNRIPAGWMCRVYYGTKYGDVRTCFANKDEVAPSYEIPQRVYAYSDTGHLLGRKTIQYKVVGKKRCGARKCGFRKEVPKDWQCHKETYSLGSLYGNRRITDTRCQDPIYNTPEGELHPRQACVLLFDPAGRQIGGYQCNGDAPGLGDVEHHAAKKASEASEVLSGSTGHGGRVDDLSGSGNLHDGSGGQSWSDLSLSPDSGLRRMSVGSRNFAGVQGLTSPAWPVLAAGREALASPKSLNPVEAYGSGTQPIVWTAAVKRLRSDSMATQPSNYFVPRHDSEYESRVKQTRDSKEPGHL